MKEGSIRLLLGSTAYKLCVELQESVFNVESLVDVHVKTLNPNALEAHITDVRALYAHNDLGVNDEDSDLQNV